MPRYFSREEAEALLPQISRVLYQIQETRQALQGTEEELTNLRLQAMGNGHHLSERMIDAQKRQAQHTRYLNELVVMVHDFGCELKDPDTGLIDFLSLRDGQEVYLCWRLGEERILYWHYLHTGFMGRQPL